MTDIRQTTEARLTVLLRRWNDGAQWTSDLADGLGLPTQTVRRALARMEKSGAVRRVATGNPISWELRQ